VTDLIMLCLSEHIDTQATKEYNNKTAFTIPAPNRLRCDSKLRFSPNHLTAKPGHSKLPSNPYAATVLYVTTNR
ncbi:MAG TPA: hypothetical protein VN957_29400, partial [Chthoniobacterales bacterium]|nr:hypothetical protein [Chthoniobacterales bacterium]